MKLITILSLLFFCSILHGINSTLDAIPLRDKIVYDIINGPLQYLTDHQRDSMVGSRVDTMINTKKYIWFSPIYMWDKSGYGKIPDKSAFLNAVHTIADHVLFIVRKNRYSRLDWSRRGKKMVIIPIVLPR